MPPKRRASGSPASGTPSSNKAPKHEHQGPDDFSNSVKKKLQTSTRTGQACDRCKVRKIRCDGLPGGCSPCLQNNTECKTTDRITGKATSRGYVETLEQRTHDQENRIRDLEARLISMGVDIQPPNGYHDLTIAPLVEWNQAQANGNHPSWAAADHRNVKDSSVMPFPSNASVSRATETNMFRLPEFRTGSTGDNYLGVSSGNSFLSSIKGTALNVLGMQIDIADFTSPDMDEPDQSSVYDQPLYNKSYLSWVQSAFNAFPKFDKVELPGKQEGLTYAQWYLRVLNPYLPVLHKPTFMALLTRMYDPTFEPSAAETVMVHMMFAIMFFQYAARNWENASQQSDLNTRSNLHYHYSLGLFSRLVASHTLQDLQALTLISAHMRNFPKPGASWMVSNLTLSLAIEMGLHRSAKRWAPPTPRSNILEIEMRKRVFWGILAIHVTISGKLGRPMPLRVEDFDVEIPEAVDDDLLSEGGIDTSRMGKCAFRVGIEAFKVEPLFMELYNNVYAVKRSPHNYVQVVRSLENKIQKWCDQWPAELTQESALNDQEGRVFALYINMWALEFRLLLRHPSLSLTDSQEFNSENLDVSLECARAMLHNVRQLQKYKSLDTTWYNGAVYVLAISTMLFGQWERRDQMTSADLAKLRDDMYVWLDIMGDVGGLIGSGKRLQNAVRVTVDNTLGLLTRHLASKTASSALSSANHTGSPGGSPQHGSAPNAEGYGETHNYSNPYTDPGHGVNGAANHASRNGAYLSHDDPGINGHATAPYPAATQYSYPEPSTTNLSTYSSNHPAFNSNPYPAVAAEALSSAPQATPQQAAAAAANAFMYSNAHPNPTYIAANNVFGGSQSWRQWTGTMAGNLEPQEYINSASALMQLGGRDHNAAGAPVADMTGGGMSSADPNAMSASSSQPWPLMIFDIGQGGS